MDAVAKLKREREALMERLAKIERALDEYTEWEKRVAGLVAAVNLPEQQRSTLDPTEYDDDALTPSEQSTPSHVFEERLREILESLEEPITRKALLLELRARNVVVGGKNELNTLGTRLYRTPWVENIKGHGYWLSERDYAAAEYVGRQEYFDEPEEISTSAPWD